MDSNSEYKASVFSLLFGEPEKALELYNALIGGSIAFSDNVEMATLSNVLYMGRINDLAFVVDGRLVVLIEHQSTPAGNLPLRLLLYIARVYEKILDNKAMYRSTPMKIPRPEFYVLYNGASDFPETKTVRLSDAFTDYGAGANGNGDGGADVCGGGGSNGSRAPLDLEVTIYNVNAGHNAELLQRSVALSGYIAFTAKVREYWGAGHDLDQAIKLACDYCVRQDILAEFLEINASEVRNMLTLEFNLDEAREVWHEEGREEGIELGEKRGEIVKLLKLIQAEKTKNKTREQIIDELELDEAGIEILDHFDDYLYLLQMKVDTGI
jgi:predicted transposase YdaD